MKSGSISVNTENIFPIIKKFLYSDQEIFLRELVSNAIDATQKIKALASLGEFKGELGELKVKVSIDKEAGTLTISDRGVGLTEEEIDKYINQIAFSGAEEFVKQYKDKTDASIIGHFGLGFYSAFMVASKVEINSLSWQSNAESAHWSCDGSTQFEITQGNREERGTDIILYLNDESRDYLDSFKVKSLLEKYCKFLPVEIEFEGKTVNNTKPIWTIKPGELKEEDYTSFYNELYPFSEAPLFWIHLNVDYPFNLTGILYFPKISNAIEAEKNKVQLYSNQVFVTDNVKEILPDYLMLLQGVVDSPDIPLNVSRSSLQSDANVKKITSHISKKVADKLAELYKQDSKSFSEKWEFMELFVKYGMLSDEKFDEKAREFCMLYNAKNEFFTIKEYIEKVKPIQTDKDGDTVLLYSNSVEKQHSYVAIAEDKGYDVLVMSGMLDSHFTGHLEQKFEKVKVKRVDAASVDKLIDKGESRDSVLDEEKLKNLSSSFEKVISSDSRFKMDVEHLSPNDPFVSITEGEFERRMKEMSVAGGAHSIFGKMPDTFSLIVNSNHTLAKEIAEEKDDNLKASKAEQAFDLALLSKNMLTGEKLTSFIKRSLDLLSK